MKRIALYACGVLLLFTACEGIDFDFDLDPEVEAQLSWIFAAGKLAEEQCTKEEQNRISTEAWECIGCEGYTSATCLAKENPEMACIVECVAAKAEKCRTQIENAVAACGNGSEETITPSETPLAEVTTAPEITTEDDENNDDEDEIDETDNDSCTGPYEELKRGTAICGCVAGYVMFENECIVNVTKTNLDLDNQEKLIETVQNLAPETGTVVTVTNKKGKEVTIAVFRNPDGSLSYSGDGKNFYDTPEAVTNPGMLASIGRGVGKFFSALNPMQLFKTKLKDTDTEKDRQLKWEIAKETLDSFLDGLKKNPGTIQHFLEQKEKYVDQPKDVIEGAGKIREAGELVGGVKDIVKDKLVSGAQTLPADATVKLMEQVNTDTFFAGFSEYLYWRTEKGMQPQQLLQNPPEEMFATGSWAQEEMWGRSVLISKYEEVYQKYLLAQQLGRTK